MTAERLADMTGQPAPADNPVVESNPNVVSQNCNTASSWDDLRSGSNTRYDTCHTFMTRPANHLMNHQSGRLAPGAVDAFIERWV